MDITTEQRAFNTIKKMLVNPTVKVTMLLPEKVFRDFNFDKFVYIKHKDIQGYFFVEKIQNYKDGSHLVRVDMLSVDPLGEGSSVPPGFISMEDSGFVLTEDGSNILMEI